MGVKDLVGIYESRSADPQSSSDTGSLSRRSQRRAQSTLPVETLFASGSSRLPSPGSSTIDGSPQDRSARFVHHPWRQTRQIDTRTSDIPLTTVKYPMVESDLGTILPSLTKSTRLLRRSDTDKPAGKSSTHDRKEALWSNQSAPIQTESQSVAVDESFSFQYSASLTAVVKSDDESATVASSLTVVQPLLTSGKGGAPRSASHESVPASAVFSRNAAPLYLPKLDEYLAALRVPEFVKGKSKGLEKDVAMFPPMDRLVARNTTLDDLEHNSAPIPGWRSRNTWFGLGISLVLGITGSSALAPFYSVQGLLDTVQIFALILNTIYPNKGAGILDKWKKLFLGTIPNIIALNFASTSLEALVYLLVFMVIVLVLLYYLFRVTGESSRLDTMEGFQCKKVGSGWGVMIVTFFLTAFYLPLSTMSVHVIIWSSDLWVVPNPYANATTLPPSPPPLGPSDQYRDPLDFCWTTTMKKNEVNFAPVAVISAVVAIASLTIWFPIRLYNTIKYAVPVVDRFTELGKPRSGSEMNREYQRLLSRDKTPFNFLYNGYRRGWGRYQVVSIIAKLSALLITALMDPDTCLFRSFDRSKILIARQVVLLVVMSVFFLLQCFFAPFLDPINNASEWTSRFSYVLTSALSLAIALDVSVKDTLNGVVLDIIYILTYGLSFYFTIINMGPMHRLVKRLNGRIDFSIDIFSPGLDVSPSSPHVKRRIWQETITTMFLTTPSCEIPPEQRMKYAEGINSDCGPYLLDFAGSPGERHVENLKILREVGSMNYNRAVALMHGPDYDWFRHLEKAIQTRFVGPDCFWKDPSKQTIPGYRRFFGNAWWIPFPPCVVVRFDDGSFDTLREVSDLREYVAQNSNTDIQRKREIRMALRALDGQIVTWPYEHIATIGSNSPLCCLRRGYKASTVESFESCVLQIKTHGQLVWQDLQIGSGFDVQLTYSKIVKLDGEIIGFNDDLDLTVPLARFLAINQRLILQRLEHIETIIESYRRYHLNECRSKASTLTYRFLPYIYDRPRDPAGLGESSIEYERDPRVRELMVGSDDILETAYERLSVVTTSELATWWYIFWDDFWRRNFDTINGLETHNQDFNPHYPTSIAYTPLPRPVLEQFLSQRGLLSSRSVWRSIFHPGFLNMIYVRLNDVLFHGTSKAIAVHLGDGKSEWDMDDVDPQIQGRPSALGTGGGTDHDDPSIRPRPNYTWETLMSSPVKECVRGGRWFASKLGVWFGLTPLWRPGFTITGLALDVKLDEQRRYVPLEKDEDPALAPR